MTRGASDPLIAVSEQAPVTVLIAADIRRAHDAGASAYVTKDRIEEALAETIKAVAASC